MIGVKHFLDILAYINFPIAIAAASILYIASTLERMPLSPNMYLIVFLVYFSVYLINKKTDEKEDAVNRARTFEFHKKYIKILLGVAILSYGCALLLAISYNILVFLLSLLPLLILMFYSGPILPKIFHTRRLKEIFLLKTSGIFIWIPTLTFMPLAYTGSNEFGIALLVSIVPFVMLFIGSTVFDMRDLEGDKKNNIITIPVRLGITRTRYLLLGVTLLLGIYIFLLTYAGYFPKAAYMMLANIANEIIYILSFSDRVKSNPLYYMYIDSEYLITALLLMAGISILGN